MKTSFVIVLAVLIFFAEFSAAGELSSKGCKSVNKEQVEANKKMVRSVFKALETGDLELLNRVFDPAGRSIIGSRDKERGGPFAKFSEAAPFPAALKSRSVVVDSIFAEGNMVAVKSKICGNHVNDLVGYRPTGKRICARYTNLYTVEGGKIVENVVGFDPELRKTLEKNKLEEKG